MPVEPGTPGQLLYLYTGSADVSVDLAWYNEVLGAELLWRFQAFGADVAGVTFGQGPVVILADHRPVPSVMPIWSVDELEQLTEWLEATGWSQSAETVEVPDGPCMVLTDRSGNQMGLLRQDRPTAMPDAYRRQT